MTGGGIRDGRGGTNGMKGSNVEERWNKRKKASDCGKKEKEERKQMKDFGTSEEREGETADGDESG